jgi:hypothetical protein
LFFRGFVRGGAGFYISGGSTVCLQVPGNGKGGYKFMACPVSEISPAGIYYLSKNPKISA